MIERDQIKEYSDEQVAEFIKEYVERQCMSGTFPNFVLEASERLKNKIFTQKEIKIGKRKYHYVSSFVDNGERMLIYKTFDKERREWNYSIFNLIDEIAQL
jgi:hypothetical protein